MRKYDLENRLISFACEVIKISNQLPKDYVGIHLGKQLIRSGTSPALNYGEAQSVESTKDFIHKMKVALKELRETFVNLMIINKSNILGNHLIDPITKENDELIAIFIKSISTAKRNQSTKT